MLLNRTPRIHFADLPGHRSVSAGRPCLGATHAFKVRFLSVSGKMNDLLARAACDFEDDALRQHSITKDTENEIAIAQCCRGILAGVVHHHLHALPELGSQNSRLGKRPRYQGMGAHWCCCRRARVSVSNSIAACPFSEIMAKRRSLLSGRRVGLQGGMVPPTSPMVAANYAATPRSAMRESDWSWTVARKAQAPQTWTPAGSDRHRSR